jgi:UDP:flavonoid glycosyltransferase YjiC (YdhE family)
MGSVVEALHFGVPMVIVPHTPENTITGRRLAELGLGRLLPEEGLTADALKAAVEEVAESRAMRENATRMQEEVLRSGGAARAVAVLEEFLAQDRQAVAAGC